MPSPILTVNIRSAGSFETLVPIYQSTRLYIPEDRNLRTSIRTLNFAC
jgi:hypothetical protein